MVFLRPLFGVAALFALGASAALCAEIPIPAAPTQWATDTAGFLSPQTVDQLDTRLRDYERTTGHQVLVYVAPTTGGTPTEDWTVRAFAKWKVGRKGLDDGLILFVFPTDHKVRIEVGYGLEATVPDAVASRIIRETITPELRAGHPDQAIVAGVNSILGVIGGEAPGPASTSAAEGSTSQPLTGIDLFLIIIVIIIALNIIVVMVRWAARHPGVFVAGTLGGYSGGGFGGGSFGGGGFGGGFSGGGGMSGGGGATGSW